MKRAIKALRDFRAGLHRSAQNLHADGHPEAAVALWAVVGVLDELLIQLTRRRR